MKEKQKKHANTYSKGRHELNMKKANEAIVTTTKGNPMHFFQIRKLCYVLVQVMSSNWNLKKRYNIQQLIFKAVSVFT